MKTKKILVGFIGQGFVGKSYADDFENRGYKVVRYSQEPAYLVNKDQIKNCDIVFIAVPTPTKPAGFDYSVLESTLKLVGKGKIAVIKSTIIPGTTKALQKKFPSLIITHSPEFLSEKTASYEAEHPPRNIIGIAKNNPEYKKVAKLILSILPKASYETICSAEDAEVIKYAHNSLGFIIILFGNLLFDLAQSHKADWKKIKEAIDADTEKSSTYMNPFHKTGRGAGGRCFIKDFAAFRESYEKSVSGDKLGIVALRAFEEKNIDLLRSTKKDLNILSEIYG